MFLTPTDIGKWNCVCHVSNMATGKRRFLSSCFGHGSPTSAVMVEHRVSGWFLLSAVFVILVFGLFFSFTERKSWPEHRIELTPMDMRIMPPVSTLWCEAVTLYSQHPFIAYQITHPILINSKQLSLQRVELRMKLGGGWYTNSMKLKFFLLPYSVVAIETCSSKEGVKLLVFKGDLNAEECLRSIMRNLNSESSEADSEEDSSEIEDFDFLQSESLRLTNSVAASKACSSLLRFHSADVSSESETSMMCPPDTQLNLVKVNITSADYYVIVLWNTNRFPSRVLWKSKLNNVNLKVLLDRTRYVVHGSGQTFDMCSLSTSCTIGLGFASNDRVLVTVPDEPSAGKSNFVILSRCKPRLAVFAVLSILFPLLLFVVVSVVVKTDKHFMRKLFCCMKKERRRANSVGLANASPLLESGISASANPPLLRDEADELPPPYHTLVDPPPSYACIKVAEKEQTN